MDNFINSLLLVPRYWIILIKESVKETAKIITEFKGDGMKWLANAWFQLCIFIIIAALIPNVNIVRIATTSISSSVSPFFTDLVIVIFSDFIFNLVVYVPAKLYFDTHKKQGRRVWENIDVRKKVKKYGRDKIYGIEITNNKMYDIMRMHIRVRYLEIDGVSCNSEEDYNVFHDSGSNKTRKLCWVGVIPDQTGISISKDGGKAIAYLLESNIHNSELKCEIRCHEFSERDGGLVRVTKEVKSYIKGEFSFQADYEFPNESAYSDLYNFEYILDGDKVKMRLGHGQLGFYKPSRTG